MSPHAWRMWGLGVLAYAMAVFNRSSLGVTALAAQHRFHVGAAVLGTLSVVQLAVYAALQVPVGVLLDRFGSRRLLVSGAVVMALGQLALALAHTVPAALLARVLVGGGDAMTFISVLRLVMVWFPPRRIPVVSQLTSILGQLGQVASAYPLVAALRGLGWAPTFSGVAGVGALVGLLVALALRDLPPGRRPPAAPSPAQVRSNLRLAWAQDGTRLGLWTHFTAMFPGTAFALLWGYPFLVTGEGLTPTAASLLLTLLVLVGAVAGPALGALVAGWPLRRSALVIAVVLATASAWTAVLAWPGRAPLALLVVLVLALATNGPASMIGFDYARTANDPPRLGSASGIVNVGGFVSSIVTILTVGAVLGALTHGTTDYTLGAFRAAFSVQYLLWGVGLANVVRLRRRLRRVLAEQGSPLDSLPAALRRRMGG